MLRVLTSSFVDGLVMMLDAIVAAVSFCVGALWHVFGRDSGWNCRLKET